MLAFKNRVRVLDEAISQPKKVVDEVNDRANGKIDEMKNFVHEGEGALIKSNKRYLSAFTRSNLVMKELSGR